MVKDEYYACLGRIVFMPEMTLNRQIWQSGVLTNTERIKSIVLYTCFTLDTSYK